MLMVHVHGGPPRSGPHDALVTPWGVATAILTEIDQGKAPCHEGALARLSGKARPDYLAAEAGRRPRT